MKDKRVGWVPIGCGNCEECRKEKSREWQTRLMEEIKTNRATFVTLTFSNEKLKQAEEMANSTEANEVATSAVRYFLERWRKKYGRSVKHWFITELGHPSKHKGEENTERIHLHGLIFAEITREELEDRWQNGYAWVGKYVNEKTINYIVKYITKIDEDHKGYKQKILASKGIGKNYVNTWNAVQNRYKKDGKTWERYKLNTGHETTLPIYYRNKIYTEEEREKLWIEKLDKERLFITGIEYKFKTDAEQALYFKDLKYYQKENIKKGYGSSDEEWSEKKYLTQLKKLNKWKTHSKKLLIGGTTENTSTKKQKKQKNKEDKTKLTI